MLWVPGIHLYIYIYISMFTVYIFIILHPYHPKSPKFATRCIFDWTPSPKAQGADARWTCALRHDGGGGEETSAKWRGDAAMVFWSCKLLGIEGQLLFIRYRRYLMIFVVFTHERWWIIEDYLKAMWNHLNEEHGVRICLQYSAQAYKTS